MKNRKKYVNLLLLFAFIFAIWPNFASADIFNTTLTADTTWSPSNGVYIIESSFYVASGTTLTIEPGTIIKSHINGLGGPSIYGKVVARGTESQPIYFTSFFNDSAGGDTDGNGPSTGSPGDWQGLYFKPGSEGIFDYTDVSYSGYGGYGYGNHVGIENDGGNINISHSNIHDNFQIASDGAGGQMAYGAGVYNKNGTLSILNSSIDNNVFGIRVESGNTLISENEIKNNSNAKYNGVSYGIFASGEGNIQLSKNNFSGNYKTAFIESSLEFNHEGNISNDKTNRGFEIGGYVKDNAILHSHDLPLILNGSFILPQNKTASILPGTIIKVGGRYNSGNFQIVGNLIAHGTKDQKIYFTSIKDDSVGGDTDGDGEASLPVAKDWEGFYIESGSADFDNVNIKYAGGMSYIPGTTSAIYNHGGSLSIKNSSLSQNNVSTIYQDNGEVNILNSEISGANYGIMFKGGSSKISDSKLLNLTNLAVYNQNYDVNPPIFVDARNNWWGSADGPKDTSTSTPTGSGSVIYGNVLYVPFLTEPPNESKGINPVIIVPGIMGSARKNGELVIDPILHTYDDLIATMEANGYQKDKNLFAFPYE